MEDLRRVPAKPEARVSENPPCAADNKRVLVKSQRRTKDVRWSDWLDVSGCIARISITYSTPLSPE